MTPQLDPDGEFIVRQQMGSINSSQIEELEVEDIFCGLPMGLSSSTSNSKGRRLITSKLETAAKTGVLNLADLDLKPSSSIWYRMTNDSVHLIIKTIDISGNAVKALPVEFYSMVNLKILHASRCSIQRVSDLSALDRLIQLDLDRNDLEVDVLGPLPTSLLRINFANNHFSGLPPALNNLVNLTELNLTGNRIESIDGIGSLTGLIILILDNNQIVEIPEDASNLIKLRQISLKNNRIKKMALSDPDLQSIPSTFFRLTMVDNISLTGNLDLKKTDILGFSGIEVFIERRRKLIEKSLQGGAMTDFDLFGLD